MKFKNSLLLGIDYDCKTYKVAKTQKQMRNLKKFKNCTPIEFKNIAAMLKQYQFNNHFKEFIH